MFCDKKGSLNATILMGETQKCILKQGEINPSFGQQNMNLITTLRC